MKKVFKNESGMVVVEATIVMPIVILCTILLYYAAIFMCQKANLQASLENAAVYYKNTMTDKYVGISNKMNYSYVDSVNGYTANAAVNQSLATINPYTTILRKFKKEDFEKIFYDNASFMFFDSGTDIKFTSTNDKNYIVYREITVTAEQTLTPAVSFAFIGIDNAQIKISSSVKFVVNDTDEFIRNLDLGLDIIDWLTDGTEIRSKLESAAAKIGDFYENYCK